MFDPENKENASCYAKQTRSPRVQTAEAPFKRRPMHEWNHPAEVSPIARPEVAATSTRAPRLKGASPSVTYTSPLQRLNALRSPNLSMLPKYSTPPSRLRNFVASNPFDLASKESLHMPVYSPSLFREVSSPPKNVPKAFSWTIDEISVLNPAPIEDDLLTSQPEEVEDSPETESKTQQMIDSYFSFHHNVESPWLPESDRRRLSVFLKPRDVVQSTSSPADCLPDNEEEQSTAKRSVACQTILSLPSILPPEVEEALMPYLRDSEDLVTVSGNCSSESSGEDSGDDSFLMDASTCSLRRRLFRDVPDTSRMVFSPGPCSSPITRGTVLLPSADTDGLRAAVTTRSYGTPLPGSRLLMSPGLSPMRSSGPTVQSAGPAVRSAGPTVRRLRRAKSKTRLDFGEECSMSVDVSFTSQGDMSVEIEISPPDVGPPRSPAAPDGVPVPHEDTSGFRFSSSSIFSSTGVGDRPRGIETLRGRSRGLLSRDANDDSNGVWEPSSKLIVSSTPAKVSP